MRKQLLCYAIRYQGEWNKILKAIVQDEPWVEMYYKGNYVVLGESNYPSCFLQLEKPPWVIFYEGNLELCNTICCGIIGSRNPTNQGILNCKIACNILKEKYTIVSGLAKGIDAIAHMEALSHKTIGVVGCGIDQVYPKQNAFLYRELAKNHLVISEYPNGSKPLAYHFPWRNRLIAALSKNIVVIEAKKKSGTMITVNEAFALGKEVYCMPYPFNFEEGSGCNLLISQGANIIVDEIDLRLI